MTNADNIKKLDNGMYQVVKGNLKSPVFKCWSTADYWNKTH